MPGMAFGLQDEALGSYVQGRSDVAMNEHVGQLDLEAK